MYNKLNYKIREVIRKLGIREFILLYNPRAIYYKLSYERNKERFKSVADPEKIIWIKTWRVKNKIVNEKVKRFYFKPIMPGNWDEKTRSMIDVKHESVVQHFKLGVAWEDTPLFKQYEQELKRGVRVRGCETLDELIKKYEAEMPSLYFNMKTHGFLLPSKDDPYIEMIKVYIGRNGEILFPSSGTHRYAIAKLLKIKEIPVQVRARHMNWQKTREILYNLNKKEQEKVKTFYVNHPDLQDIT